MATAPPSVRAAATCVVIAAGAIADPVGASPMFSLKVIGEDGGSTPVSTYPLRNWSTLGSTPIVPLPVERSAALNDRGQVLGRDATGHAYIDDGQIRISFAPPGGAGVQPSVSRLVDINNAGQAAGAALSRIRESGSQREPVDEAFVAPLVEKARSALGNEGFAAAQAEGGAWTHDAAIHQVRQWLEAACAI